MDSKATQEIASVVLAAGRGSRMKGFEGTKTLLPLVPLNSPYRGTHPILLEILSNLPSGPKALVVNYCKEDIIQATQGLGITYWDQPQLNGTGGALLAVQRFLENVPCPQVLITMGDIPLVRPRTYQRLLKGLVDCSLVVLGFTPASRKQYGVLEIHGDRVRQIIEWKYWNTYPQEVRQGLKVCNSGIYGLRREDLLKILPVLASHPHRVRKEVQGQWQEIQEFFLTDLVEHMDRLDLPVGYILAEDEEEVMGIDDQDALIRAQEIYRHGHG